MKLLVRADNLLIATLWQRMLEAAGIPCDVRNRYIGAVVGELPADQVAPQVWIRDDRDEARASALLDELPLVTGDTALVWDPIAKDWLCYGSKGVFSMDPVTWEMKLIDASGPKPERNGTFDRWFYSAKRDEFFTQNSVSNNWWAYKRQR